MSVLCTNVHHNAVNCFAAGIPRSQWCSNCQSGSGPALHIPAIEAKCAQLRKGKSSKS